MLFVMLFRKLSDRLDFLELANGIPQTEISVSDVNQSESVPKESHEEL